MNQPTSNSILSRIGATLTRRSAQQNRLFSVKQVASSVQLAFPTLKLPQLSIHWKQNLNLQHLVNLPRNALSGPVQEDKAAAHAFLKNIVSTEEYTLSLFDLRDIYGINLSLPQAQQYQSLEDISGSELCRDIRIISMRDFDKVLNRAIPEFKQKKAIQLLSASWLGLNYFWAPEQRSLELTCAIVYARRRELPLNKPVLVNRIVLNKSELAVLQQHYHVLAMPENAWDENSFMQYLINYRVPYARLPLLRGSHPIEVLLLPRHETGSDTLGLGLRKAGAQDATEFLLTLTN